MKFKSYGDEMLEKQLKSAEKKDKMAMPEKERKAVLNYIVELKAELARREGMRKARARPCKNLRPEANVFDDSASKSLDSNRSKPKEVKPPEVKPEPVEPPVEPTTPPVEPSTEPEVPSE